MGPSVKTGVSGRVWNGEGVACEKVSEGVERRGGVK